MIVPGFGTDWVCSLFWAGAMSLAWPTHFNANIVPIVSKPFFIVFASAAVWSISWIIPKNFGDQQPISQNGAANSFLP
jgi:hypothetical protein